MMDDNKCSPMHTGKKNNYYVYKVNKNVNCFFWCSYLHHSPAFTLHWLELQYTNSVYRKGEMFMYMYEWMNDLYIVFKGFFF